MITKIISGGQTGADQAVLDVAIELGIPHGGWIPKGRKTERGPLPAKYQLQEMSTAEYPKRTERNVQDSDGTLIISHGELSGGSEFTRQGQAVNGKGLFQLPQCFLDIGTVPTAPWVSLISMPCHGFFPPEDFKLSPVTSSNGER